MNHPPQRQERSRSDASDTWSQRAKQTLRAKSPPALLLLTTALRAQRWFYSRVISLSRRTTGSSRRRGERLADVCFCEALPGVSPQRSVVFCEKSGKVVVSVMKTVAIKNPSNTRAAVRPPVAGGVSGSNLPQLLVKGPTSGRIHLSREENVQNMGPLNIGTNTSC